MMLPGSCKIISPPFPGFYQSSLITKKSEDLLCLKQVRADVNLKSEGGLRNKGIMWRC